ncbi:RNA 3'-terminal phosphate cyclase-like protein [Uloborus diversus]|uniref:RNA 3'-terminal phosphate cyclase-like protein n=1 Tax=Uloborus diversus TaxID=327109 RepID=UPI002409B43D|nr:RNA 3'-terminal phosphate cyclase-like protein [Uloborus diversus]
MSTLTFNGSNFFRQRLLLSTLSGKPITIKNIRSESDEPGINETEEKFLKLLDRLTDGSSVILNETGTTLRYSPGLLLGGKVEMDCGEGRSLGYYLEPLLCLGPFCKKPLEVTLKGITNDNQDPSVDAIKLSSLPLLKRFIVNDEGLDLVVVGRGMAPLGGGEAVFRCPVVRGARALQCTDPGKVRRIRGVAYAVRLSPTMASRMVDAAKGILLKFIPDVYIYTDHYKGKHSGKSPGFGLTLVAETTGGSFYCGEACSEPQGSEKDFVVPEEIARRAAYELLEEIYRGGCVDSSNQMLACLFMALSSTDVSKTKMGPLSDYTIQFLRHIEDFMQLRMKLETDHSDQLRLGTHKVTVTCIGTGFNNVSRVVS